MQPKDKDNDNYDSSIDPLVGDPKPTCAGLNRFVEAPITYRLAAANKPPFLSPNDNAEGKSDESDLESVLGGRPFKKPRSRSATRSPESSVNLIIGDEPLESDWNVAEIADIRHNEENEAEFCDSPAWYRFAPSIKSTSQGSRYVAQVLDTQRGRKFHNIIGKEDINGEVHYLVDWTPTLIQGIVLKKAQAQPLIDRFKNRYRLPSTTRCSLNANQTTGVKPLQQVMIKSNMQVGTGKPRAGPRKSPYNSDVSSDDPQTSRRDTAKKMLRRTTNLIRTPKVNDKRKLKIVKSQPEISKKLATAISSRGRVLKPRKICDSGHRLLLLTCSVDSLRVEKRTVLISTIECNLLSIKDETPAVLGLSRSQTVMGIYNDSGRMTLEQVLFEIVAMSEGWTSVSYFW
ncbi:hypothetical protein EYC80_008489 [Monilinia laxa]|uniref:Chromo shadow domain-containing protein n=1 Tax=Monilinia laxa TaxID=61186 RepID=A0A5N6JT10_MONLA|nr:hypothetical protein EYC80_008489 [Monilinia laxa]